MQTNTHIDRLTDSHTHTHTLTLSHTHTRTGHNHPGSKLPPASLTKRTCCQSEEPCILWRVKNPDTYYPSTPSYPVTITFRHFQSQTHFFIRIVEIFPRFSKEISLGQFQGFSIFFSISIVYLESISNMVIFLINAQTREALQPRII